MWRITQVLRRGCIAATILLIATLLSACSAAARQPSHQLSVSPTTPHPLTFYEGDDDIEPFTPLYAQRGPGNTVLTIGFADREGAYYIPTYDANSWQEVSLSNGFAANDPLWDCDDAPETSVVFSPDARMMARSCADGSFTIFSLPDALTLDHQSGASAALTLTDRAPSIAFAPTNTLVAATDDGPGGAGHTITLLDTHTWQTRGTITVDAGLLSRPAWSPDGTTIAAVDLSGVIHVWNAQSHQDVVTAPVPQFAGGPAASDIAGPAPLWSADGASLYVTTPTASGTLLSAWTLNGSTLTRKATTGLAVATATSAPQLSPDGTMIFVHTAVDHGQIFTAPDLRQVADFALPGSLAVWGSDKRHIDVFTLQATAIPLQVGA
jgi:WD40 repeat protein